MLNLGVVKPGSLIRIPFDSFNAAGASSAATGLATSDIKVYKDGSVTERASTSGFTLVDTDGLDFDGLTGINEVTIDLADDTTADFWKAGSKYRVVIADITVDSQTVRFTPVIFEIGYPNAILNTSIATLASQTSFTLTTGPAEDDALNGCLICIHDKASAVQLGFTHVLDYTGSTKTITLSSGVTFTAAAGDNISFFLPGNLSQILSSPVSNPTVAGVLEVDVILQNGAAVGTPATVADIADGICDEIMSGHNVDGSLGQLLRGIRFFTAQAGAAGSITLDAGASAVNDFYKGALIKTVSGTGADQRRWCTGYNGGTKVATVDTNWATTPDNTTKGVII